MKDVETLRQTVCHCAAFDSVGGIIPEFSSSSAAKKKAIPRASSGLGMYPFCLMKEDIKNRGLVAQPGWADKPALPIKVLTQLRGAFTFHTENISEQFRFIQLSFPSEEAICTEGDRTLWNLTVNAGAVAVAKRCIDKGIVRYTSTTRLLSS